MEIKSILKELTKENGASGYEYNVSEALANHFKKYCDDVEIDKLGNVIGLKKGSNSDRKILVTAHYDEIGLLVKSIDKEGFIRFAKIGGIDPKILLAAEVIIHGKKSIPGVIGAKPPHLLSPEDRKKTMELQDLYIDAGMDYEEITRYVSIGDYITFKPVALELKSDYFASKALDNRCSFASMLVALEELKSLKHECDIYFAATVQEEVHLTGGITVSYNVDPDMAIVVDVCHGDMPDVPKETTFACGKGPAVAVGPILNKKFTNKLIDKAKYENIKYQIDVEPGGTGTEAWATQVSRCGIPTVLISIPLKYMHTAVETLNISDLTDTGRLIARFAASLTNEDFEQKEGSPIMDMQILKELTELNGVAGNEEAVREYIKNKITSYVDGVYTDALGNLIAYKKGKSSDINIMLSAHMDEVGFMVSGYTDTGLIKFSNVGGVDERILPGKTVLVGKDNIPGVISAKAIHLQEREEFQRNWKQRNLYIDIGAEKKEEAEKLAPLGEYIAFNSDFQEFGEKSIKAKALDDRVGCAILMEALKGTYNFNLYACFTVQEEIGLRGAETAAYRVNPDLALVFEGTTCSDVPETEKHQHSTRLGKGAVITIIDGSSYADKDLVNYIYNLAKDKNIPVQFKETATGGNDAGKIQRTRAGVKVAIISVPCRYIHSPVSLMAKSDFESSKNLAIAILNDMSSNMDNLTKLLKEDK